MPYRGGRIVTRLRVFADAIPASPLSPLLHLDFLTHTPLPSYPAWSPAADHRHRRRRRRRRRCLFRRLHCAHPTASLHRVSALPEAELLNSAPHGERQGHHPHHRPCGHCQALPLAWSGARPSGCQHDGVLQGAHVDPRRVGRALASVCRSLLGGWPHSRRGFKRRMGNGSCAVAERAQGPRTHCCRAHLSPRTDRAGTIAEHALPPRCCCDARLLQQLGHLYMLPAASGSSEYHPPLSPPTQPPTPPLTPHSSGLQRQDRPLQAERAHARAPDSL